jgi:hypothetical protein
MVARAREVAVSRVRRDRDPAWAEAKTRGEAYAMRTRS